MKWVPVPHNRGWNEFNAFFHSGIFRFKSNCVWQQVPQRPARVSGDDVCWYFSLVFHSIFLCPRARGPSNGKRAKKTVRCCRRNIKNSSSLSLSRCDRNNSLEYEVDKYAPAATVNAVCNGVCSIYLRSRYISANIDCLLLHPTSAGRHKMHDECTTHRNCVHNFQHASQRA